ncbi:MAG: hypothetical protein GY719_06110 [bacterium]|nr:hypothetical protein [bacterium]
MPTSAPELADLMTSLVAGLPAQQRRLDNEYSERLAEVAPLLRVVAEKGGQELARTLAPTPMVVRSVEIEAGVRFAHSREREAGVGAGVRLETELLNLGYARKYAYSEFSQSQLKMVVERVPMEPAPTPSS